eukprot:TRINITY_DN2820_c0_g1::TRINITY_DN2820_c0_g1_i1::g.5768::m.5768 TRINITY_DN2820_c0_g1::TRINITY_DN2820_c0_g1_i1::g.5768  ORF type:complete len:541 (-),score=153.12,sp/Q5ZL57/COPD_CHICK/41.06/5e-134,Adap_comp_sub/PF00928.16/6.4e-28,Clat_adaptor_s/PF01217.15/0.00022 TRINITY_DN2820_c0_g1_i1:103-1680(-)
MVNLAASILTKPGKVLVSRQFVPLSQVRIEGLLAAFPKLVDSGKQHTYIETDKIRYVYLPLETLYLLLITDQRSNIVGDLKILQLMSKLIPELMGGSEIDESNIEDQQFRIVSAFDEVVSPSGYMEAVSSQQVMTNLEMDSHEERLAKLIKQSKELEAKEEADRKARLLDQKRFQAARQTDSGGFGASGSGGASGMGGMGASAGGPSSFAPPARKESSPKIEKKPEMPSGGGGAPAPKGLQLGKAKKTTDDFYEAMKAEGAVMETPVATESKKAGAAPSAAKVSTADIRIVVDEKLLLVMNRDGGVENMEIKGEMALTVSNPDTAAIILNLEQGESSAFQFKTHPNINKQMFSDNSVLALKDPRRPFPLNSALSVLRWRMQTKDESEVPLSVTCWPTESGDLCYVNLEYELTKKMRLEEVEIYIPVPGCREQPKVNQINGEHRFDPKKQLVTWQIDLIDQTNKTGSFEFTVPAMDVSNFFPVNVTFSAKTTLCPMRISTVSNAVSSEPLGFDAEYQMNVEEYLIQ